MLQRKTERKTPKKIAGKYTGENGWLKTFYSSQRWRATRERVLMRDDYECRQCRRYGRIKLADTVHHVVPLDVDESLKLDTSNLLSLCNTCHNAMHDRVTDELTQLGLQWIDRLNPPSNNLRE